jgi:hypothetical protein
MIIKTKMEWYTTSVQKNNNKWIIQGIHKKNNVLHQEDRNILDCIITQTNLQDELALNLEYNERRGLCVISHQEIYRIEVEINNHLNKWLDRNKLENEMLDYARWLDEHNTVDYGEPHYMGLPPIVFCFWKGMVDVAVL